MNIVQTGPAPTLERLTFESSIDGYLFSPESPPLGAVCVLSGLRVDNPTHSGIGGEVGARFAENGFMALVLEPKVELTATRLDFEYAVLMEGIRELEHRSGLAASALGIGLGAFHAMTAALDGQIQSVVTWEMDPQVMRILEAVWSEGRNHFKLDCVEIPGERQYVRALSKMVDALSARTLPVPALFVTDRSFYSDLDKLWLANDDLRHVEMRVSSGGNIARPDPGFGWGIEDLLEETARWLHEVPPRVLSEQPRTAGRLHENVPPVPEDRGRVFISYKHGEEGTRRSQHASAYLHSAGFRTFLDQQDLGTSDLRTFIETVIKKDTSAGVLVVTPDLKDSSFIADVELPRLLANASRQGIRLSLDNAIRRKDDPGLIDPTAPLRLLNLSDGTLDNFLNYDLMDVVGANDGMRTFLQRLLKDRLAPLIGKAVYLDVQTYKDLGKDAIENKTADLRIRSEVNMTPQDPPASLIGLTRLSLTLPMISAELHAIQPERVVLTGGAHPSIALALGGMLASTRFHVPVIIEDKHGAWGLPGASDNHAHSVKKHRVELLNPDPDSGRVAVLIGGQQTVTSLFTDLVKGVQPGLAGAAHLRVVGDGDIESGEGERLAKQLANKAREFASEHQANEILLCHSLGFPMGVMIGRNLNGFSVVAYDLAVTNQARWYRRILHLSPMDSSLYEVYDNPIESEKPEVFD